MCFNVYFCSLQKHFFIFLSWFLINHSNVYFQYRKAFILITIQCLDFVGKYSVHFLKIMFWFKNGQKETSFCWKPRVSSCFETQGLVHRYMLCTSVSKYIANWIKPAVASRDAQQHQNTFLLDKSDGLWVHWFGASSTVIHAAFVSKSNKNYLYTLKDVKSMIYWAHMGNSVCKATNIELHLFTIYTHVKHTYKKTQINKGFGTVSERWRKHQNITEILVKQRYLIADYFYIRQNV